MCYVLLFNNINNLSHCITVLRQMSRLNCCWDLRELLSQYILANTVQYEVLVTLMSSFAANCAVIKGNYRDQLADICLDTYLTPERPVCYASQLLPQTLPLALHQKVTSALAADLNIKDETLIL